MNIFKYPGSAPAFQFSKVGLRVHNVKSHKIAEGYNQVVHSYDGKAGH